jgi:hypothetical protein
MKNLSHSLLRTSSLIFAISLVAWNFAPERARAQSTSTDTCDISTSTYTHPAAAIDKNKIMTKTSSTNLDEIVREWSLSSKYRGKRAYTTDVFLDAGANLGIAQSLNRTISINNVKRTCEYFMTDYVSAIGGKVANHNSIWGLSATFDVGGFGFKGEIPNFIRKVNSDTAFGIGGFLGINTPFLLGGYYGSSLFLSSFQYSTSLGAANDALAKIENSSIILRLNNYWAKNFSFGVHAFHFKIGANIEGLLHSPLKITNASGTSFNGSNAFSIYTLEPAAAFNYTRAWIVGDSDVFEVSLKSDVAFGATSLGDDGSLYIDFQKEYVKDDPQAFKVAQFNSGFIVNTGVFAKRSFGIIDVNVGTNYRISSGTDTSSNDLLFVGKVSVAF